MVATLQVHEGSRVLAPHILFIANEVLGWSSYAEQCSSALMARDDIRATVLRRKLPRYKTMLMRRHADGELARKLRPLDPISAHAGFLGQDIRIAIQKHKPDLVHVAAHWPAGALPIGADAPAMSVALDCTRAAIGRDLPLPGWSTKECRTEAALLARADHVFCMSEWAARSVVRDYGVAAERVTVQVPSLSPDHWPKQVPATDRLPQILFVGNDLSRKGAHRLAGWVNGPLKGLCHLHIVSKAPDPGLAGPAVTYHGRVPHDRLMSDIFPQMDIFCLPTRLDMSPHVLVEAAAAGLPAVASRICGTLDLVRNKETGVLLDPDDDEGFVLALKQLIADPALRQKMALEARALARRTFDSQVNFDRMIDILVEVVRNRGVIR